MSGSMSCLVVTIPARANTPGTLYLGWYAKHPEDTVQYCIDASSYLYAQGRQVVGSPTVTCSSEDLTISNVGSGGGKTTFLVSGGADVTSYPVTWSATLDDGTTLTRVIWLPILSLYPNTTTPTIIAKGDQGDPGVITNETMSAWLSGLPTTAPMVAGWWNNAGVPTFS